MSSTKTEIRTYDGEEVDVRYLETTDDGARLKVSHPDDRTWIVVLDRSGEVAVEVTRRGGDPADLAVPEWLTDNLSRLASPV